MAQDRRVAAFRWAELDKEEPRPLVERRRISGRRMMLSEIRMRRGCFVPTHSHESEQFTCVLSGRVRFIVGEGRGAGRETFLLEGNHVLHLLSNVPHSAEALEDTVMISAFSPPSEHTGVDGP